MSYPHLIRLRGPWQYEVIERAPNVTPPTASSTQDNPDQGRMTLPTDWEQALGTSFRGRVRFTRHFGRPTGLEPRNHVKLICDGVDPHGTLTLNGQPLGDSPGYALPVGFDVTEQLQSRNVLQLDVDFPADSSHPRPGRETLPGGPIGEVRLEISAAHWIDDFWLEVHGDGPQATLHVGGRLTGSDSPHSLELVIRGQSREFFYGEVTPGQPLRVTAPADALTSWSGATPVEALTVKLLDGATSVWQREFFVARRSIAWHAETNTLEVAGHRYQIPADIVYQTGQETSVESSARPLLLLSREIMPHDWYTAHDRAARPVIQHVPPTWRSSVCPRLAHHPSIVAWTTSPAQSSAEPLTTTHGRPWIVIDPPAD